jgi:hypothetical protein
MSWPVLLSYGYWYTVLAVPYRQQEWADKFFWDTVSDIQSLQLHTATRMSWPVLLRYGYWYTVLAVAYSNKNELTSFSELRLLIYSHCSCIQQQEWSDQFFWDTVPDIQSLHLHKGNNFYMKTVFNFNCTEKQINVVYNSPYQLSLTKCRGTR